ncbi:MAG TPA: cupin domain-containing protein [Stellaceae bacterium]|nr:cupin domain-containing protein [Stellaceae bacterium]
MVRHAKDAKWESGLRGHMTYRDTGIAYATNGEFGALVMRPREPGIAIAHPEKHLHKTGFQMVYILEGWGRFWLDGLGEIKVEKGDCFYQPDNLLHQALEISDDLELLEITMPAEFETVTP